jgi:hypothetical protein
MNGDKRLWRPDPDYVYLTRTEAAAGRMLYLDRWPKIPPSDSRIVEYELTRVDRKAKQAAG